VARLINIAIIGATGYGGAELMRILHEHPQIRIHSFHTSSQEGKAVQASYPHVQTVIEHKLEAINPEQIAAEVEIVFTATPSGISTELVPQLLQAGVKVIDLSGDYRLKDSTTYRDWYHLEPGNEAVLNEAVYGLTEWLETDLMDTRFVANPGCFPTAVLLGLAPLVKQHLIEEQSIIIDAKTGVSGAGRTPSKTTHFPETNDNFQIYRVNEHQHIPEIEQTLSSWNEGIGPVTFSSHLVPMTRGIMATMYVDVKAGTDINILALFDLYKQSYQADHFVRIREPGIFPSTKEVYGSNFCDISLAYDERTNRITIVSVIDNLMKGAAGQAVQNMNKMLGIEEKTGLNFIPVYP